MATISFSLPSDGTTADVSDYNTPLTVIKNEINGNLDNTNIKSGAAIAASKISGLNPTNFSNPYKFSVYRSGGQTITANVATKIQLNAELYDTGSNFDATTNFRFTAPIAGFYFFNGNVNLNSGTYIFPELRKNGTIVKAGTIVTSGSGSMSGVVIAQLSLSINDYIEFWVTSPSANVSGAATDTYLDGYLISAT